MIHQVANFFEEKKGKTKSNITPVAYLSQQDSDSDSDVVAINL